MYQSNELADKSYLLAKNKQLETENKQLRSKIKLGEIETNMPVKHQEKLEYGGMVLIIIFYCFIWGLTSQHARVNWERTYPRNTNSPIKSIYKFVCGGLWPIYWPVDAGQWLMGDRIKDK